MDITKDFRKACAPYESTAPYLISILRVRAIVRNGCHMIFINCWNGS